MHVITQKRIKEAQKEYPTTAGALNGWYRLIKKVSLLILLNSSEHLIALIKRAIIIYLILAAII